MVLIWTGKQTKKCSCESSVGEPLNTFMIFCCSWAARGERGQKRGPPTATGRAAGFAAASPAAPTGNGAAADGRSQPPPAPRQGDPCSAAASCLAARATAAATEPLRSSCLWSRPGGSGQARPPLQPCPVGGGLKVRVARGAEYRGEGGRCPY